MASEADPSASQALRDLLRHILATDGLAAAVSQQLGYSLPAVLHERLNAGQPLCTPEELERIATALHLDENTRSEAREFLASRLAGTGVAFSEDEIAELLESSGRHPARLQQAAAVLYASRC